ncbi:MAG: hypothetical protein AAFQ45_04050 [Pseudomonadota bacterium]
MTEPTFTHTRTIATPDGQSAFEDVVVPLVRDGPQRAISQTHSATALSFRYTPGEYAWDWHTAPRRRLIVMLAGALEVITSSGEARRFGVGDVLEVTDTTGQGHISRSANGEPFWSAFVDLDTEVARAEPGAEACRQRPDGPDAIVAFRTTVADSGAARNDTIAVPLVDIRRSGRVSDDLPLTGFQIAWASGDLDSGWHTTGRRQVVLPLTGGMDIEAGEGPRITVPPGGVYFSEDLTGAGHRTRAIAGQSRTAIFAHLAG